MARAAQEGLRPGIPLLEQGELIKRERSFYTDPWLDPTEIPVHPLVYNSPFIFTPEFARKVMEALPEAILKDDITLSRKFGHDPVLTAVEGGISWKGKVFSLERIRISVQPDLFWVELLNHANAANIRLDKRDGIQSLHFFSGSDCFMPMRKQMIYRPDKREPYMITWNRNNITNVGLVASLAFRNVAILVNNLGLQRVGPV